MKVTEEMLKTAVEYGFGKTSLMEGFLVEILAGVPESLSEEEEATVSRFEFNDAMNDRPPHPLLVILRKRFPKPATNADLALVIRRGLECSGGLSAALDAIDELVRRAGKT